MTIRGVLREMDAAQKRAARQAARAQRLAEREAKLQVKLDELERAALEAEKYAERIEQLTSIHHSVGESMDWKEIFDRPPPPVPKILTTREEKARADLARYRPNFFQRLFGSEKKHRGRLESAIDAARRQDENAYQGALRLHANQLERWQAMHELSVAICRGDAQSYLDAVAELEPLSEIQEIGCELEIAIPDARTAEVDLVVESESVIPREAKTLLKSGKLSVKVLAKTKFYELYQDYVCGCALRIARELFSFLPLDRVIVNVNTTVLDSATGRISVAPVLSVGMPKETIKGMRFERVDPSDAMELFTHRMGFKRSKGFGSIKPLESEEYPGLD